MAKFPVCVVIYLTDYCSLKCRHCFLNQLNQLNKNELDTISLKKVLRTFKDNNVFMIAYTGGDPLLHPNLFEILKYTSDLGMLPLLGLSGINVSPVIAETIYNSGVRCVQVGLNGSNAKVNDYYRGKGSFQNALNSINNLRDKKINVNISFCIDKNNYDDLENMLELAEKLNIYKVKIEFWNCVDSKSENELSVDQKNNIRLFCDNYMDKKNIYDWIQYPKSTSNLTKIHSNALVIMPNGDIKRNEMDKELGNIYKDDIKSILEGK